MQIETVILSEQTDPEACLAGIRTAYAGSTRAWHVCLRYATPEGMEQGLSLLRAICREAYLPVYTSGGIRHLDDIKKRLYLGCEGIVDADVDPIPEEVFCEARSRFGEDRIRTGLPVLPTAPDLPWEDLRPDAAGLLPCVVTEDETGDVLMVAYMDKEAYEQTCQSGRMTYWSRSRKERWVKGATSGHFQFVRSLQVDCDRDTLLARVRQIGPACHTGNRSCFYQTVYAFGQRGADPQKVLQDVYATIDARKTHPKEGSYTSYLFREGLDKILKKVGEEAAETIIAAKNEDPTEMVYEISDLLYHVMVLMREKGLDWSAITEELANRE